MLFARKKTVEYINLCFAMLLVTSVSMVNHYKLSNVKLTDRDVHINNNY